MAKPYFELYNECKNQLLHFTHLKNLLLKCGLLFTAVSLIIMGINLINENQDKGLQMAAAISLVVTVTCFIALVPVNQKIKDLRTQRKYRVRNILVHT